MEKTEQEKLDQEAAETFLKEKFPYFSNCYVVGKPAYIAGIAHARAEAARRERELVEEIERISTERIEEFDCMNEENARMKASLAEAVKALEEFELNKEILETYKNCKDETTYCGFYIGKFRKVASVLAKLRGEGKE